MTEPTDDLQQRCAEVEEWQRTGVLPGNALRNYAEAHWAGRHDSLQMAERDTSAQAMQWIAKWGTPPAVAGESVAHLHDDGYWTPAKTEAGRQLNERLMLAGSPKIAVYLAPQPTQAQAGAVPLTPEQIKDEASHHGFIGSTEMLVKFVRGIEAAHGIEGGQRGDG